MSLMLSLYWAFFQVGLLAFGGGLAALPLIREQVVITHGWLNMAAFTDLVTIAEMTPGPIALNASTFVGMRVGGLFGSVIATLGCISPSLIIVLILARMYRAWREKAAFQGIPGRQPRFAVAMICPAGLSFPLIRRLAVSLPALAGLDWVSLLCFALGLLLLRRFKASPILVIFSSGLLGAAIKLALGLP